MNEAKDGFGGGKGTIKNTPVARVIREQVRTHAHGGPDDEEVAELADVALRPSASVARALLLFARRRQQFQIVVTEPRLDSFPSLEHRGSEHGRTRTDGWADDGGNDSGAPPR